MTHDAHCMRRLTAWIEKVNHGSIVFKRTGGPHIVVTETHDELVAIPGYEKTEKKYIDNAQHVVK